MDAARDIAKDTALSTTAAIGIATGRLARQLQVSFASTSTGLETATATEEAEKATEANESVSVEKSECRDEEATVRRCEASVVLFQIGRSPVRPSNTSTSLKKWLHDGGAHMTPTVRTCSKYCRRRCATLTSFCGDFAQVPEVRRGAFGMETPSRFTSPLRKDAVRMGLAVPRRSSLALIALDRSGPRFGSSQHDAANQALGRFAAAAAAAASAATTATPIAAPLVSAYIDTWQASWLPRQFGARTGAGPVVAVVCPARDATYTIDTCDVGDGDGEPRGCADAIAAATRDELPRHARSAFRAPVSLGAAAAAAAFFTRITRADLDGVLDAMPSPLMHVLFSQGGCGFCQRFEAVAVKAAEEMMESVEHTMTMSFHQVDCAVNDCHLDSARRRRRVTRYPTLAAFRRSSRGIREVRVYDGDADVAEMRQWFARGVIE